MRRWRRLLIVLGMAGGVGLTGVAPAGASASVALDGSFSIAVPKPTFVPCAPGVECGTIDLVGFGVARWTYAFGPTFEPDGRCFDVDGTLALTLRSDGSTISGPLTGVYCPRQSGVAHEHVGLISYGNPFVEHDVVRFTSGTGRFGGLSGSATFDTFAAGARFRGTLAGSLHH